MIIQVIIASVVLLLFIVYESFFYYKEIKRDKEIEEYYHSFNKDETNNVVKNESLKEKLKKIFIVEKYVCNHIAQWSFDKAYREACRKGIHIDFPPEPTYSVRCIICNIIVFENKTIGTLFILGILVYFSTNIWLLIFLCILIYLIVPVWLHSILKPIRGNEKELGRLFEDFFNKLDKGN